MVFPLPAVGPLVLAAEFGGLLPPVFPFPGLLVPKIIRRCRISSVGNFAKMFKLFV